MSYNCKKYVHDSVIMYEQESTKTEPVELSYVSKLDNERVPAKLQVYVSGHIDKTTPGKPQDLHLRVAGAAFDYYVLEDQIHPPNLKKLVLALLYNNFTTPQVRAYLISIMAL
eukprot:3933106-Rhodomonas_salina.1